MMLSGFHDLRTLSWDFLGGAVVTNPPASAGDAGLSPGPMQGTWVRALVREAEQLSPCATTTEPVL